METKNVLPLSGSEILAALQESRADLDVYLEALAEADLGGASPEQAIAFWSNAYNAVVAHFVLELYPDLKSVKDVPGFFDKRRQRVAGEELTLDEIEDRALAPGDPRVHFAVVCASTVAKTHEEMTPEKIKYLFGDECPDEIKSFDRNGVMFIGEFSNQ